MKHKIIFSMLFFPIILFSQKGRINDLENKKKDLLYKKKNLNDSIYLIEQEINTLQQKKNEKLVEYLEHSKSSIKIKTKLKNEPHVLGENIGDIEKGDNVDLYSFNNGYWLVKKDSIYGYVYEDHIFRNKFMMDFKKNNSIEKIKLKYNSEIAIRILNHDTWIGMTREMAEDSFGKPKNKNKSVFEWGTTEQWVYSSRYLYFENDKLTAWQNSTE